MDREAGLLLDSLEVFWSIAARLESGRTVDESQWEALFRTPGYRALATEFPPTVLRPRMELALSPHRAEQARAAAERDPLLSHLLRVREARRSIEAFARRLDAPRLFAAALEQTGQWLPPGVRDGAPEPAAALAIFGPDARGYDPVVVDAWFALHLGEGDLVLLLAHEFHHWYRNRARAGHAAPSGDLGWVLDQIQAEGIADLINIPALLGSEHPPQGLLSGWVQRYRASLESAPSFLTVMDEALKRMAEAPRSAAEEARRLRKALPMAGHPVGYHMAGRIVEAGLREELIRTYADPLAFFRLYAAACHRLGRPCELSEGSVSRLERLQPTA